jgi:hypothetical protein
MVTLRSEGKYVLAGRMGINTPGPFAKMVISNSTAAESASSTSFAGEFATAGLGPATATFTYSTANVGQWVHTYTSTQTATIHKVSLVSTDNVYMIDHLFPVDKGVTDGETFTGTVQGLISST